MLKRHWVNIIYGFIRRAIIKYAFELSKTRPKYEQILARIFLIMLLFFENDNEIKYGRII